MYTNSSRSYLKMASGTPRRTNGTPWRTGGTPTAEYSASLRRIKGELQIYIRCIAYLDCIEIAVSLSEDQIFRCIPKGHILSSKRISRVKIKPAS